MKRTLLLLSSLVAFLFLATPAMAQTLYVHGGAGFPSSSNFNDAYKAGFNAGLGVGIPITSQFEALLRGNVDRFENDVQLVDNFVSYAATGNLKLNARRGTPRFNPYALAGAGVFRLGVQDNYETEFGLQFGAGLNIRTSPRASLLIEPNYIVVLDDQAGENTQYFPVRVGAAFRL